jgi:hypothetical protein
VYLIQFVNQPDKHGDIEWRGRVNWKQRLRPSLARVPDYKNSAIFRGNPGTPCTENLRFPLTQPWAPNRPSLQHQQPLARCSCPFDNPSSTARLHAFCNLLAVQFALGAAPWGNYPPLHWLKDERNKRPMFSKIPCHRSPPRFKGSQNRELIRP